MNTLSRYAVYTVVAVAYAFFISGYLDNLNGASIFWTHRTPPGQITFVIAKWLGLTAIFVLLLHVLLGIFIRIQLANNLPIAAWRNTHEQLAHWLFNLVLSHVVLFVTAVSLRTGKLTFDPLKLNVGDYYHQMLTVGVAAGALLLLTSLLVFLRKTPFVRQAHKYLGISIAGLALWHALAIGSEVSWQSMLATALILATLLAAIWQAERMNQRNAGSSVA